MQTGTLLMMLLATLLAALLALYHYVYKAKQSRNLIFGLAFLRFFSWLAFFLLLINPQLAREAYSIVHPNLLVLIDNSASIQEAEATSQLSEVLDQLARDTRIKERFQSYRYRFGAQLHRLDSLDFSEETTNLATALASVNEIYAKSNTAIVLLTDGNQTLGQDYEFTSSGLKLPVYPVVIGDTTRYEDLRIEQVISNTYAFLNNQYPLETFITYEGPSHITATLTITVDGKKVQQERLQLSPEVSSTRVHSLIRANSVGVNNIRISVSPLEKERNTSNNQQQLAVEVINEKTKVALVADVLHPDLGALEKSIESNEQRTVVFLSPAASADALEEIDIFLLYQPGSSFSNIYDWIKKTGASSFTVTGSATDWDFLNHSQQVFQKEDLGQSDEILPILNPGFSLFDISGFSVEDFPPLLGELGEILITRKYETLIGQQIRGVDINEPLLAIIDDGQQKEAVLFGENLWKWRMQCYRNRGSFENFDALIGKILLFLGTKDSNKRFNLDYRPVYKGSREAVLRATYFDETFQFDPDATLLLKVKGRNNRESREIRMLLKGKYYEADLSDLPAGNYGFIASVEGDTQSETGNFTILEFEVEKQLIASNYKKLQRVAEKTGGSLFFPSGTGRLIEELMNDERYLPTQKSEQIIVSLIDYRWLLAIIAAALSAEWFIRKYNGLI